MAKGHLQNGDISSFLQSLGERFRSDSLKSRFGGPRAVEPSKGRRLLLRTIMRKIWKQTARGNQYLKEI